MLIEVFTYTDEDEKLTAIFRVLETRGFVEAELQEATLRSHFGKVRELSEFEVRSFGVFEELVNDAIDQFDPMEDSLESDAIRADELYDLIK